VPGDELLAGKPAFIMQAQQAAARAVERRSGFDEIRGGGPMRCKRNSRMLDGSSPRAAIARIAAIDCISATRLELNTISPMRWRIDDASRGVSVTASGTSCTTTMSRAVPVWIIGHSVGLPQ
jgi:hypothetical protein